MKSFSLLIAIASIIFLPSCEEISPVINPIMGLPDTTTIDVGDQERQVLIEEFTGVRCVQCPAGSAEIENLLAIHGSRLVAVSIHAGGFSPPYAASLYDFRTPEGDQIQSFLGKPFGYPSAVINRTLFDGEFDLQLSKGQWAGFIAQEKEVPTKVKVGISTDYNATTRKLNVEVLLVVVEDILDPDIRLSLMLTESGVMDLQLTPEGENPDYLHRHVLRDMLTTWDGDPLTGPLFAGTEVTENYSLTLDESWVVDHCSIIAFVNLGGDSKEVLQVTHWELED